VADEPQALYFYKKLEAVTSVMASHPRDCLPRASFLGRPRRAEPFCA
jgi:hypothetical protein